MVGSSTPVRELRRDHSGTFKVLLGVRYRGYACHPAWRKFSAAARSGDTRLYGDRGRLWRADASKASSRVSEPGIRTGEELGQQQGAPNRHIKNACLGSWISLVPKRGDWRESGWFTRASLRGRPSNQGGLTTRPRQECSNLRGGPRPSIGLAGTLLEPNLSAVRGRTYKERRIFLAAASTEPSS
jgi:hypothetical protein